jgi:type IV pilus assembly protein PilA
MNNKNKKRKGFTLIELIVVIAILAILAAVAVPNFIGLTNKATTAVEIAAAAEYANAINITNALSPDSITEKPETMAALDTLLGSLKPSMDSSINAANVLARINIGTDGFATVIKGDLD